MKKWMLSGVAAIALCLSISSCLKNDTPAYDCSPVTQTAPATEVAALKTYLDTNGIAYSQDNRGFFYSIDSSAATGTATPSVCSAVSVVYTGTLLNGTVFDSTGESTPASFPLGNVIIGWQEAVPLMKTNAVMMLYLPPSLAYGSNANGPIPANSNLIFKIKLLAFN